ncbi:hypothetical protein KIN20_006312 [Parelaphostrongylus tenuis]|uniref:Uncharacterized protein n=1 Tax=Parelaphostrongylus tenuis TaxID=148309 RepID=A0AAD5MK03_PARTN|nr:hypothetical protein KIN20_006312 [Parelaphostrongylus tenuis]
MGFANNHYVAKMSYECAGRVVAMLIARGAELPLQRSPTIDNERSMKRRSGSITEIKRRSAQQLFCEFSRKRRIRELDVRNIDLTDQSGTGRLRETDEEAMIEAIEEDWTLSNGDMADDFQGSDEQNSKIRKGADKN